MRLSRCSFCLTLLLLFFVVVAPSLAADVTWNNGGGNFRWNTSDINWNTGAWNNANGDGAIFGATGAGAIDVNAAINVNSIGFIANGYTLNGSGPLNFVSGTSTLGTGTIYVDTGLNAAINTPINSSLGLIKLGSGTLQLAGPITFSGSNMSLTGATNILYADFFQGAQGGVGQYSGTTRIMNTSVLPTTTRLGISNGLVDFMGNNQTLGSVTFYNDNDFFAFNPAINAAGAGIIGTGTLRVNGEINVLGNPFGANGGSNAIAMNLDMGGGTQVIRVSTSTTSFGAGALMMTGIISNGSLLKTLGFNQNGVMNTGDGIGLFGNNTYTGSTRINGGANIATGTNASTSVEVFGNSGLGIGVGLALQGANGSYLSATTLQVFSGGTLILDNNSAVGGAGNAFPTIAAAQNNNRLADNAQLQMRDGNFTYRGLNNVAASETIGSIAVQGGHNTFTINTGGTGTATFTVANDLTMAARSSLAFSSGSLGVNDKVFVNGMLPAADATGILPRIVSTTDFLTYSGATGFTPYTAYATDFSTPGTNVSVTAAGTVSSSVNINALKRGTSSFTTTIGAGVTLGITSGMILSSGGTGTFTGGTIAFGSAPGTFFGTNTINSALTGSNGLLNAAGTLTLNGDLSGLTGTITQNGVNGTTTLATNTFAGAFEVREGGFNINTSLGAGGAINVGVAANDVDLVGATISLSISGAGANATIARDVIVNNGTQSAAGAALGNSFIPGLGVLSNSTGSQTLSGNITLNSPLRIQGGGATGTGATNVMGNITGSSFLRVVNGRVNFSGNYSNAGGFWLGENGTITQVNFNGVAGGTAPLIINGANAGSFIAYTNNALPTGTISTNNITVGQTFLTPLDSSTINNNFVLSGIAYQTNPPTANNQLLGSGSVSANVGAGISATWAGTMSGQGGVYKDGPGTLTLSNASNTYTGFTTVNAGTLLINGNNTSASNAVASGATLGGIGNLNGPVIVNFGGTISPGNSVGIFSVGNLTLSGTFLAEINLNNGGAALADLLNVNGTFSISGAGANLQISLLNLPASFTGGTFLLAANDGSDAISGVLNNINGLPAGYSATVDYAFTGPDSLGRIGTGNDLAVRIVPEPQTYALFAIGALFLGYHVRSRRRWSRRAPTAG